MSDHDNCYEKISSLMDGELKDAKTAFNDLHENEDYRCKWQRYHLMREALRDDNQPVFVMPDIASRVMDALESEPVVLAPRVFPWQHSAFIKPVAGFAIAATVAVVTVLGLQTWQTIQPSSNDILIADNTQNRLLQQQNSAATSNLRLVSSGNNMRWQAQDENTQESLNEYLMNHTEHSSSSSMQGMLPYVRLAGFDKSQ